MAQFRKKRARTQVGEDEPPLCERLKWQMIQQFKNIYIFQHKTAKSFIEHEDLGGNFFCGQERVSTVQLVVCAQFKAASVVVWGCIGEG